MTTTLRPGRARRPAGLAESPVPPPGAGQDSTGPVRAPLGGRTRTRRGLLARHPAWPVTALLAAFPLWWALGIADFMWIILAIPMAVRMIAWRVHGNRRLRLPPAFGLWLLFLLWAAAGVAVLTLTAPGTVQSPISHRVLSYGDRTLSYLSLTVLLLYVGNLTERELPRRRLAWLIGLVGISATILGIAGMIMPHFQFKAPFLLMLPRSLQSNAFVQASMHPALSQVQNVFGGSMQGRPKAPFDYTNIWGDCLSITVPWLLVACRGASRRLRFFCWGTALIALGPLIYSLNRGVWIGVGMAVVYVAVRLAARGRLALLGGLCAALAVVSILVIASPLQNVIIQRLQNGRSDNLRSNLSGLSIEAGLASPIIGYGDTRQQRGSPSSIAVGPTLKCPICGQAAVGSTGQLWLLIICDGFVGAALYLGFFAAGLWRYRRDPTGYGLVGLIVIGLSFLYMFTYDAVPAPLGFTMLAYALLWRNEAHLPDQGTGAEMLA